MTVEERIQQLGLVLPDLPKAAGSYQSWVRTEELIFVSGQFPIRNGVLQYLGKLGRDLRIQEGYEAAKLLAVEGKKVSGFKLKMSGSSLICRM